jgi:hypothetical protein
VNIFQDDKFLFCCLREKSKIFKGTFLVFEEFGEIKTLVFLAFSLFTVGRRDKLFLERD